MKKILTTRNMLLIAGAMLVFAVLLIVPGLSAPLAGILKFADAIPTGGVDIAGSIKKLKEDRAAEFAKCEAILTKTTAEKRSRNDQEKTEWEASQKKIKDFDEEIRAMEALLEQRNQAAKDKGINILDKEKMGDDMAKVSRRYSIAKALRETRTTGLTGVEKEMDAEGVAESRGLPVSPDAGDKLGFSIPSSLFAIGKRQQRALTIGTEGADIMQTDLASQIIPILAPNPVVAGLGANIITGLTGDFQYTRHNGAASMTWQGETTALTSSTPTFDNVKLSPNSLGGYIEISDRSLVQANFGIEAWVRSELERAFGLKLDLTALSGSGSGSEPTGIANTASIGSVSFGPTVGGAPTWAKILEFISALEAADADMGSIAFLSTPQAKAKMMSTPKQSSGVEGNFILGEAGNLLAGYKFVASNQCRHTLTEGASGNVLSEMFFANWRDLFIGQFGAVNILINPYLKSRERLVSVEISSHFDIKLAHLLSFVYAADMVTT